MSSPSYPTRFSPNLTPLSPGSPMQQHHRAPSLGEIHQELESEQEGQVNRLLGMIRQQRAQIQTLQTTSNQANGEAILRSNSTTPTPSSASTPTASASAGMLAPTTISSAISTPATLRSRTPSSSSLLANISRPSSASGNKGSSGVTTTSPLLRPSPSRNQHSSSSRTYQDIHHNSSHVQPRPGSPNNQHHYHNSSNNNNSSLTPTSSGPASATALPNQHLSPNSRRPPSRNSSFQARALSGAGADTDLQLNDEIVFCKAETVSLERENRMLRARIVELEGLVAGGGGVDRSDGNGNGNGNGDGEGDDDKRGRRGG